MKKPPWIGIPIPSPLKNAFMVIAVVSFLIFAGRGLYQILFPIDHRMVECLLRDSGGRVVRKNFILPEKHQVEDFAARAEKRGETCTMSHVRKWHR
jgi:hypothetical protein